MPKWTEYTTKDTLADNDEVMLYDATGRANKRGLMSKFWDYVVDKMATAVIGKLKTENKTVIGALNYLNGNKISNTRFAVQHIRYTDPKVAELGGLDACVKDALNNTILKDGAFYGTFIAGHQYLMIGYRYVDGKYGCIILFDYNNNERWSIINGKVTKS
jgi:hypothetical protein|nr:MAG TPA: hypothetical protein [Bacteriophage sp.]